MAVILITHDLGIVAQMTKRVIVMYMGTIVEEADVYSLFKSPLHPYTQGLLHSRPVYYKDSGLKKRLVEIKGSVGSLLSPPAGCYFSPRCPIAQPICREERPMLREARPGHAARCWKVEEGNPR
jgi:peptide/nickel transport system ATP-binding protein